MELLISNIVGINDFNATIGGSEISILLDHYFPLTNSTLKSGDLQARINFDIQEIDAELNLNVGWTNYTTPWNDLLVGESNSSLGFFLATYLVRYTYQLKVLAIIHYKFSQI